MLELSETDTCLGDSHPIRKLDADGDLLVDVGHPVGGILEGMPDRIMHLTLLIQNKTPQKNSKGEYSDYVLQLRSSSCLLDYLDSILSAFCQCDNIGQNYKRFFAVLHNKEIPTIQSGVQPIRPEPNTSPEKALIKKVENNNHIQLHTLLI